MLLIDFTEINVKSYEMLLCAVLFIIWIYVLSVFKKRKLAAFHYIVGAAGLFAFIFVLFKKPLTIWISYVVLYIMDAIGQATGFFTVFSDYNLIFIDNSQAAISMYIDYECCGVIEILVLVCLVVFYPMFGLLKRIFYSILGVIYVMAANVIRLFIVSIVIYRFGNNSYYVSHAIVGRIIFYILTILLYFYMLSYNQIKNQKVGKFDYGIKENKEEK